jgi:hypothetical protein
MKLVVRNAVTLQVWTHPKTAVPHLGTLCPTLGVTVFLLQETEQECSREGNEILFHKTFTNSALLIRGVSVDFVTC